MEIDINPAGSNPRPSPLPQGHFVYMVECADGSFYSGYTTNVGKRISTHNAGKGAKYTRARLPVALLACWSFSSKGDALRAEYAIKRLSRVQKKRLIEQTRPVPGALPDWIGSILRSATKSPCCMVNDSENGEGY